MLVFGVNLFRNEVFFINKLRLMKLFLIKSGQESLTASVLSQFYNLPFFLCLLILGSSNLSSLHVQAVSQTFSGLLPIR